MSLLQLSSRGCCCFDFTPFFKNTEKYLLFRLPVRPTPAFPLPYNLSATNARLSASVGVCRRFSSPRQNPSEQAQRNLGGRGSGTGVARVNQHPPMHYLAVLSMGWAAIFSFSLNQSTFFGFWPMGFFGAVFFSTLIFTLPSHLVILLT
jgi:hypothetical protein